jgi:hypothetical protein
MPHTQTLGNPELAGLDRTQINVTPDNNYRGGIGQIPNAVTPDAPEYICIERTNLDLAVNLDREHGDENGEACGWLRPGTPEVTMRLHGSGPHSFLTLYAGELHLGTLHGPALSRFLRVAVIRQES